MEILTTRTANIHLDNDIIHLVILPKTQICYDDAVENSKAIRALCKKQKYYYLIDVSSINLKFEKEAQRFMESTNISRRYIAIAILIGEAINSELRDFVCGITDSKVPTVVFHNYDEATNWLKSFKG